MATRLLQHRDINEPIARLVREHLGELEIAAIHHGPLTRALQDVVHDLIARAQAEAVAGTGADGRDPMPVFSIKAKDRFAPAAVEAYRAICENAGLTEQAHQVALAADEIRRWQARNPDRVKFPDHPHVPVIAQ